MKKLKITFKKLIGGHYCLDEKMEILNWMLSTGKNYDTRSGRWTVDGVSQKLFNFSANAHNYQFRLPLKTEFLSSFFDSIFARAVFEITSNYAIIKWREKENVLPEKSRIIKCNYRGTDNYDLIRKIKSFDGMFLKKEYAHPDYKDRKEPKIIDVRVYTIGNGWIVDYTFSFKKFKYEPGWSLSFGQTPEESITDFFERVCNYLSNAVIV